MLINIFGHLYIAQTFNIIKEAKSYILTSWIYLIFDISVWEITEMIKNHCQNRF